MKYRYSKRKQTLCFTAGLALSGLGVALSTSPGLGTSPISSLPYTMTFIIPWTFGVWTVAINLLFILGQMLILRKNCLWLLVSQLLAVSLFGFFIDLGMWLTHFITLEDYFLRVVELILGCVVLAAGIACQLTAQLVYIPGEGLVRAIAARWNLSFGRVKVAFDTTLVVLSIVISLICCGCINGLREGTLLAALLVGNFVQWYRSPFRQVKRLMFTLVRH